jgi:Ca2+-transporting ATPase
MNSYASEAIRQSLGTWAIAWELVLLVVIVYVPFLPQPFGTFTFAWTDWALAVALAFTIVPVLEAVKWFERQR